MPAISFCFIISPRLRAATLYFRYAAAFAIIAADDAMLRGVSCCELPLIIDYVDSCFPIITLRDISLMFFMPRHAWCHTLFASVRCIFERLPLMPDFHVSMPLCRHFAAASIDEKIIAIISPFFFFDAASRHYALRYVIYSAVFDGFSFRLRHYFRYAITLFHFAFLLPPSCFSSFRHYAMLFAITRSDAIITLRYYMLRFRHSCCCRLFIFRCCTRRLALIAGCRHYAITRCCHAVIFKERDHHVTNIVYAHYADAATPFIFLLLPCHTLPDDVYARAMRRLHAALLMLIRCRWCFAAARFFHADVIFWLLFRFSHYRWRARGAPAYAALCARCDAKGAFARWAMSHEARYMLRCAYMRRAIRGDAEPAPRRCRALRQRRAALMPRHATRRLTRGAFDFAFSLTLPPCLILFSPFFMLPAIAMLAAIYATPLRHTFTPPLFFFFFMPPLFSLILPHLMIFSLMPPASFYIAMLLLLPLRFAWCCRFSSRIIDWRTSIDIRTPRMLVVCCWCWYMRGVIDMLLRQARASTSTLFIIDTRHVVSEATDDARNARW